ncbi:MAG: Helicase associated domain protein [Lachnospiraceae bacterium]|nr:Helicase associated domain protein [Lachnospiraceae bacterium]
MEVLLYEHNMAAYEAAVDMMEKTGKAAVIHPTGTGKSFIGFRLCADNPGKRMLWLSPSEYIFKTQLENLQEATGGEVPGNITFCTYAKLMLMDDAQIAGICGSSSKSMPPSGETAGAGDIGDTASVVDDIEAPGYIILDEFHRCGARCWGQGVQRLLAVFPDTPILGLSATNIRYLDNQRDMADELFDGNIASEMTLGEALVRGILNPPKYVLSVYSWRDGIKKYEERVRQTRNRKVRDECECYLQELRRALDMADGLDVIFDKHMTERTGKYIVFCSNKEHMDEMMRHTEWFAKVDQHPHVYSIYTSDPGASRAFDDFRNDKDDTHLRLLYCIDALNEGVHIEGISGVILLRPTVSPIIYKQQIGRALSASRKETSIIFDIVSNLESIWNIGAVEEEMQLVTSYYRDLGKSDSIVNEHFRIIDEVHDCRELFEKLNEKLTASWDRMYSLAKQFYQENGNLEVPAKYFTEDGYALGNWIVNQRAIRKGSMNGSLSDERIRKLDSIGMIWETATDLTWAKNYAAAKRYRENHGDLNVPVRYVDQEGVALGTWLSNIRAWENAGAHQKYLTPDRIQKLNDLGMVWDVLDYYWEKNYHAAYDYYLEHRNLDVPIGYVTEDGIRIGYWICRQRSLRAGTVKGTVPNEDQIRRLDAIGMIWTNRVENKWTKAFQAAEAYAKSNGNLLVPANYVTEDGFHLGTWIQRQRTQYKRGTLPKERQERLEAIGMSWEVASWQTRFELVQNWYLKKGTLNIPQDTVVDGFWIGKWIAMQKKYLKAGKLSQKQIELLAELPLE